MNKKTKLFILLLLLSFFMTGCWSQSEPKEMAIITCAVYDLDENNNLKIYLEMLDFPNIASNEGGGGQTAKIVTLTGTSFPEMVRDTKSTIDKMMYAAHNRARIFTETFAKNGLTDTLDFLIRDYIADERPYMFVLKGDTDPMLLFKSNKDCPRGWEIIFTQWLKRGSKTTTLWYSKQPWILLRVLFSRSTIGHGRNRDIPRRHLPHSEESGENEAHKYYMSLNGLAVFKDNKLVGYLDKFGIRVYNLLTNNIAKAYISFPVEGSICCAYSLKTNCKIDTRFEKGAVYADVKLSKEIMIVQNNSEYDVSTISGVKKVQEELNNYLKTQIEQAINQVQTEFKSDIFGIGDLFHKQNPEIWKIIQSNWDDDYFANAIFNVNVDANSNCGTNQRKIGEKAESGS